VKRPVVVLAAVAVAILAFASAYALSETEQAILVQFGKPVGGLVTTPGLHFKVPFVQDVHRFDKRWLDYEGGVTQIPTRDKKYIVVEIYARWRIADPLRFFQAVHDERGAQLLLDDIVDGQTRNAVASYDLIELVRSSNTKFETTEELEGIGAAEAMAEIQKGRSEIAKIVLEKAAEATPQFGIELVDVRFKRISYVETVQQKVFDRMISERKRIAERSRSEGQGRAAEIRGQKERDVLAASSMGYRTAQALKGAADAKATAIYARAYGKDPEFYQFSKTLDTLNAGLDDKTWLILSTDSELLKYLKGPGGPGN
jgi:modulator of FtsH protease HflC